MLCSIRKIRETYSQQFKFQSLRVQELLNKNKALSYAYLIGKIMGDGHLSKNYLKNKTQKELEPFSLFAF